MKEVTETQTPPPAPVSAAPEEPKKTWNHPGGKLLDLGSGSLGQKELLAVLLGSGTGKRTAMEIADLILDEFVHLPGLHRRQWPPYGPVTVAMLCRVPGVKRAKAARIWAAVEIARRMHALWGRRPDLESQDPPDARLIADILGAGVQGQSALQMAEALLRKYGSLAGLYGVNMDGWVKLRGLNSVKAVRLCAALELYHRIKHWIK